MIHVIWIMNYNMYMKKIVSSYDQDLLRNDQYGEFRPWNLPQDGNSQPVGSMPFGSCTTMTGSRVVRNNYPRLYLLFLHPLAWILVKKRKKTTHTRTHVHLACPKAVP